MLAPASARGRHGRKICLFVLQKACQNGAESGASCLPPEGLLQKKCPALPFAGMPVSTEAEVVSAARQLQVRRQAARGEEGASREDRRSNEGPSSPGMSVLVKRGAAGCTLIPPDGGAPISQAAFPVDKVLAAGLQLPSSTSENLPRES